MSRQRIKVATYEEPKDEKASRDQIKAFATYAETTEVTTKNRGHDI